MLFAAAFALLALVWFQLHCMIYLWLWHNNLSEQHDVSSVMSPNIFTGWRAFRFLDDVYFLNFWSKHVRKEAVSNRSVQVSYSVRCSVCLFSMLHHIWVKYVNRLDGGKYWISAGPLASKFPLSNSTVPWNCICLKLNMLFFSHFSACFCLTHCHYKMLWISLLHVFIFSVFHTSIYINTPKGLVHSNYGEKVVSKSFTSPDF